MREPVACFSNRVLQATFLKSPCCSVEPLFYTRHFVGAEAIQEASGVGFGENQVPMEIAKESVVVGASSHSQQ